MKLAIVPAVALAACGAALAASPASATPAESRQATVKPGVMDLQKAGYGGWEGEDEASCEINQWFPGFNILSGNVLNDVADVPVNVVVAVLNVLSPTSNTSDQPIINGNC